MDIDKTLGATQPWHALGISRATWYRREAEKCKAAKTVAWLGRPIPDAPMTSEDWAKERNRVLSVNRSNKRQQREKTMKDYLE